MKKLTAWILTAAMLFTLCACGASAPAPSGNKEEAAEETSAETEEAAEAEEPAAEEPAEAEEPAADEVSAKKDVNVYVLTGPTGIGAVNLWEESE